MNKCSFIGTIEDLGTNYLGGLVGYADGIVQNCFVRGSISSDNTLAGVIVDHYKDAIENKVKHCYFAGELLGSGDKAPIVYYDIGSEYITNCYYDNDIINASGFNNSYGKPRATDEMTFPYDYDTFKGWEFAGLPDASDYDYPDTVDLSTDTIEQVINKVNDGYPELGGSAVWFPAYYWIATGYGYTEWEPMPAWIATGYGYTSWETDTFLWVKFGGSWNEATGYVKSGGTWEQISSADVKKGGSWD